MRMPKRYHRVGLREGDSQETPVLCVGDRVSE